MKPKVKVASFNAENLFTRFKFKRFTDVQVDQVRKDGFIIDKRKFDRFQEAFRDLTAKTVRALKADIVCLQEVEGLDTLKLFNSRHLKTSGRFRFQYVIDGNDPRLIDLGILSNFEVDFLGTHQFLRKGRSRIFSRDCLEAYVKVGEKTLPIFGNHLKSMVGGRARSKQRRLDQSEAVLQILEDRFGKKFGKQDFIVLGDLNDYMDEGEQSKSGIRPLLESNQMENVLNRLPKEERWTHFYKGEKSYNQLDYILLSQSLARKNPKALPFIERRGQPKRVNQARQPKRVHKFFPEIEQSRSKNFKASDHCPVGISLEL